MSDFREQLKAIVGDGGFQEGDDIGPRNYRMGEAPSSNFPPMVLRPKNTEEVSKILKLCDEMKQPIVVQGGITGLVAATQALSGEIALSTERMNKIEELDEKGGTLTVQTGVQLQRIQEHADENGFLFPLDLGARGSCTIGGNMSTNAGGNRVIRYGMTRAQVLGLEAVLADGTIINSLYKFEKNNTGYDLKQLFIGAEGTLGVITRVILKLQTKPKTQSLAFCALEDFEGVTRFLNHMKRDVGANLSAFEVMWAPIYELIVDVVEHVKAPLPKGHPFYVLTEAFGTDPEHDQDAFEAALADALEQGIITDAVIAKSETEIAEIWEVRDGVTMTGAYTVDGQASMGVGFDVSLAIGDMEQFGENILAEVARRWENGRAHIFGHLGDGNLHLAISPGLPDWGLKDEIDALVYDEIERFRGSVSAEHGIGILKRKYLKNSRTADEIALMKTLKATLDPNNILGQGRIFEPEEDAKLAAAE